MKKENLELHKKYTLNFHEIADNLTKESLNSMLDSISSSSTETLKEQKRDYFIISKKKATYKFKKSDDHLILNYIKIYGKDWSVIASFFKNCKGTDVEKRYYNYIDINRERFSQKEDEKLMLLYKKFDGRWKIITSFFPNRPLHVLKNRYFYNLRSSKNKIISDTCNTNNNLETSNKSNSINNNQQINNVDITKNNIINNNNCNISSNAITNQANYNINNINSSFNNIYPYLESTSNQNSTKNRTTKIDFKDNSFDLQFYKAFDKLFNYDSNNMINDKSYFDELENEFNLSFDLKLPHNNNEPSIIKETKQEVDLLSVKGTNSIEESDKCNQFLETFKLLTEVKTLEIVFENEKLLLIKNICLNNEINLIFDYFNDMKQQLYQKVKDLKDIFLLSLQDNIKIDINLLIDMNSLLLGIIQVIKNQFEFIKKIR